MFQIVAPISLGELVDKITILEIKTSKLTGSQLFNAKNELSILVNLLNKLPFSINHEFFERLKAVNLSLWEIEDLIRKQEKDKTFGEKFVNLARSVYLKNDERFLIKKEINTLYKSSIFEEKSYQPY